MDNLLLIALAFFLVLLNGFFVASEFAIVKLRLAQAEAFGETHGWVGRILRSVRSHLDGYLSACQLGITLASLGLGWIGEPAFAALLEPLLAAAGVTSPEVVHGIAVAFAFAVISFLHIVVGELAPKSLAIRKPEAVSLWTATPLFLFYWLMYPFIYVLNGSANIMLRRIGVELAKEGGEAHSVDEIRHILSASHVHGDLNAQKTALASRALDFFDLAAGDVMQPVSELTALTPDLTPEVMLERIEATHHSRYPVFEHQRENLLGVVHIKQLMPVLRRGEAVDLNAHLRKPLVVRRDWSLGKVLGLFRGGYPHLALVTDELGHVIGFVTLHHLIEALFGRIQDEFGRRALDWKKQDDGSYIGSGAMPLHSLERLLGVKSAEQDVDSVGGLVMSKLDRVPQPGDRAEFDGFEVWVRKMRGPKITQVQVYAKPAGQDAKPVL